MTIVFKNNFGAVKNVKFGFSWTMFFFGFWVPVIRGDWKWAIITFLLSIPTFGFFGIVFAFMYNKTYINELLAAGYRPVDESGRSFLQSKGVVVPN
jgi:hypothetical protein